MNILVKLFMNFINIPFVLLEIFKPELFCGNIASSTCPPCKRKLVVLLKSARLGV